LNAASLVAKDVSAGVLTLLGEASLATLSRFATPVTSNLMHHAHGLHGFKLHRILLTK
jgi:hypothetical protein